MGRLGVFVGLRMVRCAYQAASISRPDFYSGLLFAGRMSDLFGRKMLYLGGLATFCVFSILSAVVKASPQPTRCEFSHGLTWT